MPSRGKLGNGVPRGLEYDLVSSASGIETVRGTPGALPGANGSRFRRSRPRVRERQRFLAAHPLPEDRFPKLYSLASKDPSEDDPPMNRTLQRVPCLGLLCLAAAPVQAAPRVEGV